MKLLLIMPDAHMHKMRFGTFVRSMREAPLTLTTLAGLLRDHQDIEFKVVDESVEEVPLDFQADLVGISVMTGTARRAYALADHFRRRKLPVVLGGVHVTIMPEEARQFADCIVRGMADTTWPELIADFKAGRMKKEYVEVPPTGDTAVSIPAPRYDLVAKWRYMIPWSLQATRGCMHRCDFCTVPVFHEKYLRRPIPDIVRDIQAMPGGRFAMNDVSPFDDVEWAKELMRAIAPLKKKWGGLATTMINQDKELFDLVVRSGCQFLLIGFESVNQQALRDIYKGFNRNDDYDRLMADLRGAGIICQGCFVFGFDEDDATVFAKTVQRVQELRVDIPRYSIYTPYPNTALFKRLEQEGRILSYDWGDYDTMHVVYRPAQMSPVELYEGFRWAYRETFKLGNIWERTWRSGLRFPIAFVGNLTYRMFVKRLYMDKAFEMPVTCRPPEAARPASGAAPGAEPGTAA